MRHARPFVHLIETVVLAYELNQSGVTWHLIHRHLGRGLRDAVCRAKRDGIHKRASA